MCERVTQLIAAVAITAFMCSMGKLSRLEAGRAEVSKGVMGEGKGSGT